MISERQLGAARNTVQYGGSGIAVQYGMREQLIDVRIDEFEYLIQLSKAGCLYTVHPQAPVEVQ